MNLISDLCEYDLDEAEPPPSLPDVNPCPFVIVPVEEEPPSSSVKHIPPVKNPEPQPQPSTSSGAPGHGLSFLVETYPDSARR